MRVFEREDRPLRDLGERVIAGHDTETLTGPDPDNADAAERRTGLHKKELHTYGTLRLTRASEAVVLNPAVAAAPQPAPQSLVVEASLNE